ncbi:MAG: GtrA family protein [Alphaproteobacteria bacterium]|nr:GtrA family protein [Alphaproteobacteria bacterium]
MRSQFLAFLLVGGFAAAANWGSRFFFSLFLPLTASIACAYLFGMTVAYALNRLFVFERSGRSAADEYGRFALVNVVALAQVWLVTLVLGQYALPFLGVSAGLSVAIAHAIGVASPVFTSYFGHRHFTFAARPSDAPPSQRD